MLRRSASAPLILALAASTAVAGDPSLSVVTPRGVQRGTETTFTFNGDRLGDAAEVLFYSPGFEVLSLEADEDEKRKDKRFTAVVRVAPDVPPGEHVVQVRSASGVSDFKTIHVGVLPEVAEVEPNDEFAEPQVVPLDHTVTGVVENEEVDFFAVDLQKGQALSVEVEGLRLGTDFRRFLDPYVAILDADRFELAAVDDTAFAGQDPVASFVAPETGRYMIELRDGSYEGGGHAHYRMHVGTFPRPLAVYPPGGPTGEAVEVTLLGDPAGPFTTAVTPGRVPPRTSGATEPLLPERDGKLTPTPLHFRAAAMPNVLEAEPNDARDAAPAAVALPAAFNGVLTAAGDTDWFRFTGTKDRNVRFDAYARRVGSPADLVFDLYGPDGKRVSGADDARGLDPFVDFRLPADGDYTLAVRDHLRRGGETFVYRVEVADALPLPSLSVPRNGRYGQDRQRIVVPRGGRFATRVLISRQGFGGELALAADPLPEGVTLAAPGMPKDENEFVALFEAAEDAPLGATLAGLTATRSDADSEDSAKLSLEADLVQYRNNEMLLRVATDRIAVAVVETLPFSIEVVPPAAPLTRAGSMPYVVKVHRDEGFGGKIGLEFPQRAPGVSTDYKVTVEPGETEKVLVLNANEKAKLGTFPAYVLATANVGGTAINCSPLFEYTVIERPATLALDRAAAEQGTETQVVVKPDVAEEFEGEAKVTLLGLPPHVTAPELTFAAGTEQFVVPVTVGPESPLGTHKNLLARVELPRGEGSLVWTGGSTELRIDKPTVVKPPEETEPEAVAETKPAEEKPKVLSRLEKLRLEAEQRLEANTDADEE